MKQGAYHYANKPFNLDEIVAARREGARDDARCAARSARCARARPSPTASTASSARARAWSAVKALLQKVATSPASTVLLTGRERDGQGPRGEGHSLQQQPRVEAVHEHHVLGAAGSAARKRAVRPRARRVHRRRSPEARAVRDGGRRHGVSRRDRRDGARRCRRSCCGSSKRRRSSASAARPTSTSTCA